MRILDKLMLSLFLAVIMLLASGCSHPLRTESATNELVVPGPLRVRQPSAPPTDAGRRRSFSVRRGSVRA